MKTYHLHYEPVEMLEHRAPVMFFYLWAPELTAVRTRRVELHRQLRFWRWVTTEQERWIDVPLNLEPEHLRNTMPTERAEHWDKALQLWLDMSVYRPGIIAEFEARNSGIVYAQGLESTTPPRSESYRQYSPYGGATKHLATVGGHKIAWVEEVSNARPTEQG